MRPLELDKSDVLWMFDELGIDILYNGQQVIAIVDWDAVETPPYGKEKRLSSYGHEVTILNANGINVKRGDPVVIDENNYLVEHITPLISDLTTTFVIR